MSALLGQDLPRQVPHPGVRVLEEPIELLATPAGKIDAVVEEALDVALALAVLALLRRQTGAIAAEVPRMVAAGEALVWAPTSAAPAEMSALAVCHDPYAARTRARSQDKSGCTIWLRVGGPGQGSRRTFSPLPKSASKVGASRQPWAKPT
jgi:hypothetical protein